MEQYDVAVFGAGPAGLCAAIQAARGGARTLLVEKNGIPGGTMTCAGVSIPGLFDAYGKQVISGIGWELVGKSLDEAQIPRPDFSRKMTGPFWTYQVEVNPFLFAAVAEEEMTRAGVQILYHTMVGKASRSGEKWDVVLCGKDGLFEITAKILIDCTGDANLTKIAGYGVREPAICQPGTASILLDGVEMERTDRKELAEAFRTAVAEEKISSDDLGYCADPAREGKFLFLERHGCNANHICGILAADSVGKTRMELAGRRSILRAFRFLKGKKGLQNLMPRLIATECGVRESRTVIGEYTMTEDDYASGRIFEDALCWSFYPMDLHDAEKGVLLHKLPDKVIPRVPRSILIPKDSVDFLVAGRIVSSDRMANAGLRIQATCMATGQAAAANALCALDQKKSPAEVPPEDIRILLRKYGAIVP